MASIFGQSGEAGKNLAKLGVIAGGTMAGVGILQQILKISTESSGHFAATAKLWDTSIRMIFRPIGDTIGLVLRPFALMMIKWAVPFYQKFAENIPDILTGGEKLAEGDIIGGGNDIQAGIIGTLFGKEAKARLQDNQRMFDDIGNSISEFFESLFVIPEAYGDTGEEIRKTSNSLNIFSEMLRKVQTEIGKRMTLDGLGVEAGSDFTSSGQAEARSRNTTVTKLLSKTVFDKLVESRGTDFVDRYMESRGYTGISDPIVRTGKNPRAGSQGIVVNINNPKLDDPQLGVKIQREVQKELKKLPGRR